MAESFCEPALQIEGPADRCGALPPRHRALCVPAELFPLDREESRRLTAEWEEWAERGIRRPAPGPQPHPGGSGDALRRDGAGRGGSAGLELPRLGHPHGAAARAGLVNTLKRPKNI